jgi:NitT/TauT family transport system substrate-binding protein
LCGAAFAGAALVSRAAARADESAAPFDVLVASAADDDITPVLYADQAGWFHGAGLAVHVDRLNNGTAVAAAVAGGAVNVGKVSMLAIILAHARGVPLTIIAPCSLSLATNLNSGVLVRKDSNIFTARDLSGKIVAVPALNDMQALSAMAWIDKNGGNSKDVSFVEEPSAAVGLALDTNRIAAGALANPVLSQDMATGKYRSIGRPVQSVASPLMISAWVSEITWAEKNAAVVRKFGQVVVRAGSYANTHHNQTANLIAAFSGIDPDTVKTMARAVFSDKLEGGVIQPLIDTAARYGAIKQRYPATELFSPAAFGLSR